MVSLRGKGPSFNKETERIDIEEESIHGMRGVNQFYYMRGPRPTEKEVEVDLSLTCVYVGNI